MAGVNVFAADTDGEAQRLFTSAQQQFTNMVRNRRGKLQPPLDDIESYWTPPEKAHVTGMLKYSFVGSAEDGAPWAGGIRRADGGGRGDGRLAIFDHAARLRSYELLAEVAA